MGANTPATAVFNVDDVILGVSWGNGTNVADFTSDARVAFGEAIGEAEKLANEGILKIKRWRAGTVSTVQITLPIMGAYTATTPYSCPKSEAILQKSYAILEALPVRNSWVGAIDGVAMLATGEGRFNQKISDIATLISQEKIAFEPRFTTWDAAYELLFLSEYYIATSDATVIPTIQAYLTALSQAQGMNGTFGHYGSLLKADGSFNGPVPWYGLMNSAGLVANLSMVVGKKAIEASGSSVAQTVTDAIERGNVFFSDLMLIKEVFLMVSMHHLAAGKVMASKEWLQYYTPF